ncbi:cytochrome P450 [Dacryopinax primogenitus]|uniref:Cytochrome P450 n=1 Tax=Dacryopinax primogenitus (strain DJM 731) TaxID=1858805 RepID=M5FY57_DACPD|nr:cytochrome P450 [Dacryopinax primogenitus]EJU00730.1 cytochrome P450 [Dacryopinax primogenitus]
MLVPLLATCAIGLVLGWLLVSTRRPANLPPGPKRIPVFGNLFQTPSNLLFTKLTEWSKEYGGIFSYDVMGQPIIVLSAAQEAGDVLDRLSAKTSDRPPLIKAGEFLCKNMQMTFLPRGKRWRTMRRAAHESLNVRVVKDYAPMLKDEATILVEGLVDHPDIPVSGHIHRVAASMGWRSIFGHEAIPLLGPDPSHRIEELAAEMSVAMLPGGSVVDVFPMLKPIIARSKFLRKHADRWFEELSSCFLHAYSTDQIEGQLSVSGTLKETGEKLGLTAHDGAWIGAALFFAAEDTTACSLLWFIYAILLYPETASAARQQLADIVGDRPPEFSDRDKLPHIEALVKEVLRWRPPVPMSIGHAASEDFEYKGYTIPKGAVVVANLYGIGRDPKLYSDGERFDPARFIDKNGQLKQPARDSKDDYLCFGHGRRICLGKDISIESLWITFAYLLWAFDIKKRRDSNGDEVNVFEPGFLDKGATLEPVPFPLQLCPRYIDLKERLKAANHGA